MGRGARKGIQTHQGKIINTLLLVLPNFSKTIEIECDASGIGIGGVLMQEGRPLTYFSEKLSGVALNCRKNSTGGAAEFQKFSRTLITHVAIHNKLYHNLFTSLKCRSQRNLVEYL